MNTSERASAAAAERGAEPLFDAHAHFYSDDITRFPLNAANRREGEAALTRRILADPGTPERVFREWDQIGIRSGAAVQYNNAYKTDNRYALHVGDMHGARVSTVVILDPLLPQTPADIAGMARDHNVSGLRIVGFSDEDGGFGWLESNAARATFEAVDDAGIALVVMFRLRPGERENHALAHLQAIARRHPAMSIVLDHFGWPATRSGTHFGPPHLELAAYDNVFFKFTSLNVSRLEAAGASSASFIAEAVDRFGGSRIMWGSDFGNTLRPYADMATDFRLATLDLPHSVREQLCVANAAGLFGGRR